MFGEWAFWSRQQGSTLFGEWDFWCMVKTAARNQLSGNKENDLVQWLLDDKPIFLSRQCIKAML
jgi:hypothetical protein